MFKIEETNYGYHMTFEGFIQRSEMEEWVTDLRKKVGARGSDWGNLVDVRASSALPAAAQEVLFEGIVLCRERGMERAAIVVSNPISKIQAMRVVKETGIEDIVRFVDASSDSNWEESAMDWISKAVVPA